MTDESMTQTGFEVDARALEQAKENVEFGGLSKELRRTIHRLAYGAETTKRERVREELEQLRDDKREVIQEKHRLESKEQELQRKIERKEEELDNLQDTEAEYSGMLESIEVDLQDGKRILPDSTVVEKAAEKGDKTPADVIDDLKERNPDIPAEAFRASKPSEPPRWDGVEGYNEI